MSRHCFVYESAAIFNQTVICVVSWELSLKVIIEAFFVEFEHIQNVIEAAFNTISQVYLEQLVDVSVFVEVSSINSLESQTFIQLLELLNSIDVISQV